MSPFSALVPGASNENMVLFHEGYIIGWKREANLTHHCIIHGVLCDVTIVHIPIQTELKSLLLDIGDMLVFTLPFVNCDQWGEWLCQSDFVAQEMRPMELSVPVNQGLTPLVLRLGIIWTKQVNNMTNALDHQVISSHDIKCVM